MKFEMLEITSCSCYKCKQMCKTSPCIGTPEDILRLYLNGYKESLKPVEWIDLQWNGFWPVIAPIKTESGCIFLTESGLCKLHDVNLKPSEGRFAIHDNPDPEKLRRQMCFTWVNQKGYDLLRMFNADTAFLDRLTELRQAYSR